MHAKFARFSLIAALAMMIFVISAARSAVADTVQFQLTVPNSALSGYPGPYADGTIAISGDTATFTITTDANSSYQYYLGDRGTFGFNSTVAGTVSGISTNGTGTTFAGSAHEDGFGLFGYTFDTTDGTRDALSSLSFLFTASSPLDISDFTDEAGHVIVCAAGQTPAECTVTTALTTGFAGSSGTSPVPEPGSLALLGSGLLGIVGIYRHRRSK